MSEDNKKEFEEKDVEVTTDKVAEESIETAKETEVASVEESQERNVIAGIKESQFAELTNKNKQFMLSVDKKLSDQLHYEVQERVYAEMVDTLLDGQINSQTARQIYGTPTETANLIMEQEFPNPENAPVEKSPDWQIALDGGLMLGSLFTFITGISMLNADAGATSAFMGLTTLIINYIVADIAMLVTSKVMPDLDAPKGERRLWRYFGVSIAAMFGWFLIVSISAVLLPPVLNPVFEPMTYIIIAAITIGLRFLLKRQLNIQGGVF